MIAENAPSSRALAVAVVALRSDGKTLLIKRAPGRWAEGYWTPVTGKVEPGETLAEAGAREVLEEVGLMVEMGKELYRCPTEGAPFDLVWIAARLGPDQAAETMILSDEIAEARWLSTAEAASLTPMFAVTAAFYAGYLPETW